jgi:hypothetical protein
LFGIAKSVENTSLMEIKSTQLGLTSRTEGPPSYAALLAKRPRPEVPSDGQDSRMDTSNSAQDVCYSSSSKDVIKKSVLLPEEESEERKPAIVESVLVPISSVLTKPPPLVKITPVESCNTSTGSATSSSVLSIPKWGSPQIAPQDLSIASRSDAPVSDEIAITPNIQRAPIIVSAKRLSPSPTSSGVTYSSGGPSQPNTEAGSSSSSDPAVARPLTKSVIVCHRPSTAGNVKSLSIKMFFIV